jgi:hypothetical protein
VNRLEGGVADLEAGRRLEELRAAQAGCAMASEIGDGAGSSKPSLTKSGPSI